MRASVVAPEMTAATGVPPPSPSVSRLPFGRVTSSEPCRNMFLRKPSISNDLTLLPRTDVAPQLPRAGDFSFRAHGLDSQERGAYLAAVGTHPARLLTGGKERQDLSL